VKKKFSEIKSLAEFDKEFKKLLKKYRSLEDDLNTFIDKQLVLYHKLDVDNQGVFQISNLAIVSPKIYKAKKFACKALKGRGVQSGIRIIYAYYPDDDKIEFIEIYHKNQKENEDTDRIIKNFGS
jgi:mRNA-degrading endonuclease RelE of RelBE toxin-antitoxin system